MLYYILQKFEIVLVAVVPFLCCAGLIFCLLEVITVLVCADSAVITHPDRYLMIIMSGGLNQRRIGVR
jgi:hypothetical protein